MGKDGRAYQVYPRPRQRRGSEQSAQSQKTDKGAGGGDKSPKTQRPPSRWKAFFSPSSSSSAASPALSAAAPAMAKSASVDSPSPSPHGSRTSTPRTTMYGSPASFALADGRRASEPLSATPVPALNGRGTFPEGPIAGLPAPAGAMQQKPEGGKWKKRLGGTSSPPSASSDAAVSTSTAAPNPVHYAAGSPPPSPTTPRAVPRPRPSVSTSIPSPRSSLSSTSPTRVRSRPLSVIGLPSSSSEFNDTLHLSRAPSPSSPSSSPGKGLRPLSLAPYAAPASPRSPPLPLEIRTGRRASLTLSGAAAGIALSPPGSPTRPLSAYGTRGPATPTRANRRDRSGSLASSLLPASGPASPTGAAFAPMSTSLSSTSTSIVTATAASGQVRKKPSLSEAALKALMHLRPAAQNGAHDADAEHLAHRGAPSARDVPSEEEILSWRRGSSRLGGGYGGGYGVGSESSLGSAGEMRDLLGRARSRSFGTEAGAGSSRRGSDDADEVLIIAPRPETKTGRINVDAAAAALAAQQGEQDAVERERAVEKAAAAAGAKPSAVPLFPSASAPGQAPAALPPPRTIASPFPTTGKVGPRRPSRRPKTAGAQPDSSASPFLTSTLFPHALGPVASQTSPSLSVSAAATAPSATPFPYGERPSARAQREREGREQFNVLDFVAMDEESGEPLPPRVPVTAAEAAALFPAAPKLERMGSDGTTSSGISLGSDEGMVLSHLEDPGVLASVTGGGKSSARTSPLLPFSSASQPAPASAQATTSKLPSSMHKLFSTPFASPFSLSSAAKPKAPAPLSIPSSRAGSALAFNPSPASPPQSAIPLSPTASGTGLGLSTSTPPPRPPRAPRRPATSAGVMQSSRGGWIAAPATSFRQEGRAKEGSPPPTPPASAS
ncbi:hypothetical protein JCM10213v2_006963 [Rhodosporidiobolus nylandii]